eukprot:TRINITY_DN10853_c0_g1_i1.p2 TRINITY_DN10853_c0_g1~~TRINITY_DN10853_c0_g1_i1.p2  ORF type:complete len:463 (+),score=160.70 TRINITY_DN10853_c0_g1_i1:79-1389(+)
MRGVALLAAALAAPAQGGVVSDAAAERLRLSPAARLAAESFMETFSGRMNKPATEAPPPPVAGDGAATPLTLHSQLGDDARCMDGSPYGFYYRPAPNGSAHANDWVMFMQGGGLCITLIDCRLRAKGNLGSSKGWGSTHLDQDNVLNSNASVNPFWDFNHVWLPYCSGDTHTGTQTKWNAYGLYFAGALNFERSVRALLPMGLSKAQRVILSGGSAGGIGAHNNADVLQSWLPSAQVMAMPMGGHFLPTGVELSETQELRHWHILAPAVPINDLASLALSELYSARVPLACGKQVPAEKAYRCWDASFNYDYIGVPTLWIESMYDQLMIEDILLCFDCPKWANEYIEYFGVKMRASLNRKPLNSTRRNAVWSPACFVHTDNLCMKGTPQVSGVLARDVARSWYFDGKDEMLLDPCATSSKSLPCNQHCLDYRCGGM